MLELLKIYATGPRPIRIQLCVCLAILAVQMTGWEDVVPLGCINIGQLGRKPYLRSRLPKGPPRRGHRRTKDKLDSMWAELHHPESIYTDVGAEK